MFKFESTGSFDRTENWLQSLASGDFIRSKLDKAGREGVAALRAATPMDSSVTANSWTYEIKKERNGWSIIWSNTNVVDGTPVVILLQYGHGTRNGGYVKGRDFINPAVAPVMDRIGNDVWKAVNSR